MSICINCGCDCENILCGDCLDKVDKRELCLRLIEYNPNKANEPLWDRLSAQLLSPYNFKSLVFAVTADMPSPSKEYLRILCRLSKKGYIDKAGRSWLYEAAPSVINSDKASAKEKETVKAALLNAYMNDYRYSEAEEIFKEIDFNTDCGSSIRIIAEYLIKTRRYGKADELLNKGLADCMDDEFLYDFRKLLTESEKRRLGKDKGGYSEYLPADDENRKRYVEFMASLGTNTEIPTAKITRKVPTPIPKADYPALMEYRDAGFKTFVAYDIETTGLSASFDSIIEIGAVRVVDGVVREEQNFIFQKFAKPYKSSISPKITELTGITKEMVAAADEMWDVFNDFADFIGDDILVGFNNNRFDDKFIVRAGRYANRIITNKSFDVMTWSAGFKNLLEAGKHDFSLSELCQKLCIENPQAHRALADAVTTARVYLALLEIDKREDNISLDDMLSDDDWN